MTDRPWDVVVVGAGILGLATARELLHRNPDTRVLVLEREPEIATHQTGHNSGVIHAGIYYAPGSLKAQLCTAGREALYEYCDEHGIAYERCGKLIIALDDTEIGKLDELERRGRENGVPGLSRLDASGLREIEPHATGVAALHSPETGIIDFAAVARTMAAEIQAAGRRDPHRRSGPPPLPQRPSHDRRDQSRAQSQPPRPSPAPASGPTASPRPPASPEIQESSPSEAAT